MDLTPSLTEPAKAVALARTLLRDARARWRSVHGRAGGRAVAFRAVPQGWGFSARLYVKPTVALAVTTGWTLAEPLLRTALRRTLPAVPLAGVGRLAARGVPGEAVRSLVDRRVVEYLEALAPRGYLCVTPRRVYLERLYPWVRADRDDMQEALVLALAVADRVEELARAREDALLAEALGGSAPYRPAAVSAPSDAARRLTRAIVRAGRLLEAGLPRDPTPRGRPRPRADGGGQP